ncbi:hypothetical protein P692DRAFT_20742643 [Suillus brevipes Sb2]|nr:hypothetical protein P692DRAFT_20742643 [Suillus brevipes Sb2]
MGWPQDRTQCVTLAHDNVNRCSLVTEARTLIYERDLGFGSAQVEHMLKPKSWVPTLNAFSDHLNRLGFNIFCTLIINLLHGFEIGVWKMLFM